MRCSSHTGKEPPLSVPIHKSQVYYLEVCILLRHLPPPSASGELFKPAHGPQGYLLRRQLRRVWIFVWNSEYPMSDGNDGWFEQLGQLPQEIPSVLTDHIGEAGQAKLGVSKLMAPGTKSGLRPVLVESSVLMHPCSFVYVYSTAASMLQWPSWVTRTEALAFVIWPLAEEMCPPLAQGWTHFLLPMADFSRWETGIRQSLWHRTRS